MRQTNEALVIRKRKESDRVIALAGNPNVGKSTIFNQLTGMHQRTGNWPGKTVTNAQGEYTFQGENYIIVDLPGTYSLMAHSAEEEVARDFICSDRADAVVIVCDATCLERNLILVLQTLAVTDNVVICVNLIDEARKKRITIDFEKLESQLGVPVVATNATAGAGLEALMTAVAGIDSYESINEKKIACCSAPVEAVEDGEKQEDIVVTRLVTQAEAIAKDVVFFEKPDHNRLDRKIDHVLIGRWSGIPVMILLLGLVLWLTIVGSNYPSVLLAQGLFWIQEQLLGLFDAFHVSALISDMLIMGVYRVVAWVVSVMLPPMAIFFPLFTLLEDLGYLPRAAFNLDHQFKKCNACGKQALTMCMGFGCNAAGVIGCRIIDSPRERLIAIITNNFTPCNGRFPTLIAMITMFFVAGTAAASVMPAFLLTVIIVFSVCMTFMVSKLLSATLLKGHPSSFTLELPPYRKPQIGKIIVRSIFDRTLFVLGRAVSAAAPAGLIIWAMANVSVGDVSLLTTCANFFDPFARLIGLDGVIFVAFVLGFPANEIVIPIILMAYLSKGSILELDGLAALKEVLVSNGWTWLTAVCVMLFSLMHWPCATTCLTIKKEVQSLKWTAAAFALPTVTGIAVCFLLTSIVRLLGFMV